VSRSGGSAAEQRSRVLSGIQPTGELHIGNYLGAVRNWVRLQDEYECFYPIVDYHAIASPFEPRGLRKLTEDMLVSLVAAGLDPDKCHIFIQSEVPEHTELAWVLTSLAPLGQLQRMTQFKDKTAGGGEAVNAGLLMYPVLQSADILLYKADRVPVGEDQSQHLELARMLARRFNNAFGESRRRRETTSESSTRQRRFGSGWRPRSPTLSASVGKTPADPRCVTFSRGTDTFPIRPPSAESNDSAGVPISAATKTRCSWPMY
jgi:tryptophanyl-tRNA synthetase